MDLRKLRHAVALAHHLNFTKAAAELNITQSALSRSIQALESECQLRLFDRNRNLVAITPAGRNFLPHAQALLRKEAEMREMIRQTAQGDGGSVALGIAPLAARTLIAPLMTDMIENPGFHASVTIGTPKTLLPMLLDETIDLCVCTGRDTISHALLAGIPLARFSVAAFVRPGHPLTRLSPVMPSDLNDYPLLRTRHTYIDDEGPASASAVAQQPPALVIEDYDVLMRVAAGTDAVWITSSLSGREGVQHGALTEIPIRWPNEAPHAAMSAYYLKNRTLLPTSERILEKLVSLSRELIG
jgi:DNA-binding transcriptional LysR family regulator